MGCIYKATIRKTDSGFPKSYIGQTSRNLEKRKKQHKNKYRKGDTVFYRACLKYGWENVEWEILRECNSQKELDDYEIYYIDKFRTYIYFADSQGYNMTLGRQGGSKFTFWNAEELKTIGEDIKKCVDKKEIETKYGLKGHTYFQIARGEKWSLFTQIPYSDLYERNTCLTKYQVDKIVSLFKQFKEVTPIVEQMGIKRPVILNVLKGKSWASYTGILDEKFYNDTVQKTKYSENEIQQILKSSKNSQDLSKELNIPHSTIVGIRNGKTLGSITGIVKLKKEDQLIPSNASYNRETADKIIQEYFSEGKTKKELSEKYNLSYGAVSDLLEGHTCNNQFNITPLTEEEKINLHYKTNKITLVEVKKIVELQKEGKSENEIFEYFGEKFSKGIINNVLNGRTWSKYTGIKLQETKKIGIQGKTLNQAIVDIIVDRYYRQNQNCKEIEDAIGIDRRVIWSVAVGKTWSSYTGIKYIPKNKTK